MRQQLSKLGNDQQDDFIHWNAEAKFDLLGHIGTVSAHAQSAPLIEQPHWLAELGTLTTTLSLMNDRETGIFADSIAINPPDKPTIERTFDLSEALGLEIQKEKAGEALTKAVNDFVGFVSRVGL